MKCQAIVILMSLALAGCVTFNNSMTDTTFDPETGEVIERIEMNNTVTAFGEAAVKAAKQSGSIVYNPDTGLLEYRLDNSAEEANAEGAALVRAAVEAAVSGALKGIMPAP